MKLGVTISSTWTHFPLISVHGPCNTCSGKEEVDRSDIARAEP
jgi:hypothetical protein